MIAKFNTYCEPRKNETYNRYVFRSTMKNDRSFDVFLTDLKTKAKQCGFGNLGSSMIKDQIVMGVEDASLLERLLRDADLTLDTAEKACLAAE